MQEALGALFSSGWTLDETLGLTWDQLEVVITCVVAHRTSQINAIAELAVSALGGKVERPGASAAPRRAPRRQKGKRTPEERDAAMEAALSRMRPLGVVSETR